jgi:hypothetical protein
VGRFACKVRFERQGASSVCVRRSGAPTRVPTARGQVVTSTRVSGASTRVSVGARRWPARISRASSRGPREALRAGRLTSSRRRASNAVSPHRDPVIVRGAPWTTTSAGAGRRAEFVVWSKHGRRGHGDGGVAGPRGDALSRGDGASRTVLVAPPGLEPGRSCDPKILSLLRMPIPPRGLGVLGVMPGHSDQIGARG